MLRINLRELPRVIVFGQVRQAAGWQPPGRKQPNHMIVFVQDGDIFFHINNKGYQLQNGDYLLVPQGIDYTLHTRTGCQYFFVHFEIAEAPEMLSEFEMMKVRKRRMDVFQGERDPSAYALPMDHHEDLLLNECGNMGRFSKKIGLLLAECEINRYGITPSRKMTIDLRFAEILNLLDQNGNGTEMQMKEAPAMLTRMIMYIHQHYSEPVTLTQLSDTFHVSKQYIAMLFREYMKTSATQYINRVKLDHALDLLRYSTIQIGEISDRLGFSNAYYFSRLFRKYFGMTPSEYIRMHGERWK